MPGLSCGLIRLVYMFLPPIVGTRKLVAWSSLLYALPMLGWFFAVQSTETSFGTLLALAFACGIGGGSFSGYMPSTGYFFPKRLTGTALGIQAGIGNMGMSIIQLLSPWLMGFGLLGITWIAPQHAGSGQVWVHNVAVFFIPWTIVAALLAFALLKDVPVKANIRQQIDIFTNPDTWYMTLMYVATFGLFSGFAAQFGLLIKNTYGPQSALAEHFDKSLLPLGATYAFLGPLIGSVVRMLWGPLCDRFGGAIWTFISIIGMGATLAVTTFYLHPTDPAQFPGFLWSMLAMFFFSGLGNAGTFKQMPMIMPKRQAGGAIGFPAGGARPRPPPPPKRRLQPCIMEGGACPHAPNRHLHDSLGSMAPSPTRPSPTSQQEPYVHARHLRSRPYRLEPRGAGELVREDSLDHPDHLDLLDDPGLLRLAPPQRDRP